MLVHVNTNATESSLRAITKKTMGQCQCSSSKRDAAADVVNTGSDVGSRAAIAGEEGQGKKRLDRGISPLSVTSDKASGSVYFDAAEGDDKDAVDTTNSFSSSFTSLQIDGQYFFSAKDDPNISNEAFAGIKAYPPLPTTEPDAVLKSPASVSNIQSLLHSYQHEDDGEASQEADVAAEKAAEKAGTALENQSRRLMLDKDATSEYLGKSSNLLLKELNTPKVREKGFPGELTDKELDAVKLFRSELQTKDPIYKQIVSSFSTVEREAYALCRFLRARKFDVEKVFELLDEAKEHYAKARESNFYPDLEEALGFSRPVFMSQYPAVFAGNAKNGCPVMYFRLGLIQPEGLKCIASIEKLEPFFWNDYMHAFPPVLAAGRHVNPNFARTENITVYDLKGVSRAQITSDTFEVIKIGARVMSSFPETLHCLLIINAPSWFGFVWSVAKKLIDARTASKITVFTSTKAGDQRMKELIDIPQIPSCYGGTGPSLAEAAAGLGSKPGVKSKMVVLNKLMSLTKKQAENSHIFELKEFQHLMLALYTRCKAGATATLIHTDSGNTVAEINIVGEEEDKPYSRAIGAVKGPGSFTIKLKANSVVPCMFLLLGVDHTDNESG